MAVIAYENDAQVVFSIQPFFESDAFTVMGHMTVAADFKKKIVIRQIEIRAVLLINAFSYIFTIMLMKVTISMLMSLTTVLHLITLTRLTPTVPVSDSCFSGILPVNKVREEPFVTILT